MTLGKREYNDADMMRMQRDAEERVREMQSRAREVVENENGSTQQPRNRNWTSGQSRRNNNYRRQPAQSQDNRQKQQPREEAPPPPPPPPPPPHESAETPKATTIIEDVMGALKLDEDYLLIIGLLLILINQRADTTLILALAYLLI